MQNSKGKQIGLQLNKNEKRLNDWLEEFYKRNRKDSLINFIDKQNENNNVESNENRDTSSEFKKAGFHTHDIDYAVDFFLSKGISVNRTKGPLRNTVLIFAVLGEFTSIVKKLVLVKGINLDHQNGYPETALACAINNENLELVKILLEAGANINLVDYYGETPIFLLMHNTNLKIATFLAKRSDIDLNIVNKSGETFLTLAALNELFQYCKIALENGADPNIGKYEGKSVLKILEEHKQSEERDDVIQLVKSHLNTAHNGRCSEIIKISELQSNNTAQFKIKTIKNKSLWKTDNAAFTPKYEVASDVLCTIGDVVVTEKRSSSIVKR